VKKYSSVVANFVSSEASAPSYTQKIKFRLHKKLTFAAASALICFVLIGLPQSARADDALTIASIKSRLSGEQKPFNANQTRQPYADDAALAALNSFAQQIPAAPSSGRQFDDHALAALRDFAQRLGADKPQAIKSQLKLAEAGSLLEFLQQGSAPQPSSPKSGPVAGGSKSSRAPVAATIVGAKVCMTCHATQAAAFEKTLMGRIGKTQKGKFDCENCHGPGSAHVKAGGGRGVGGIISFRPEDQARTSEENNAICLTCHERGDRTYWNGSTHETRGLMCTNCHTIMKEVSRKRQLKTAFEPDTCFQCHKDRRAQMFRTSHMPLREGKVVCSDCHNPHGTATASLLRANSINDNCYKCHAEKRGPFLFEHAPVRESCVNCHDPHGSVNEYMLKISRPRLCTTCHAFGHGTTSGPLAVQSISRQCNNCHTEVHGTNSPSGPLLHR